MIMDRTKRAKTNVETNKDYLVCFAEVPIDCIFRYLSISCECHMGEMYVKIYCAIRIKN